MAGGRICIIVIFLSRTAPTEETGCRIPSVRLPNRPSRRSPRRSTRAILVTTPLREEGIRQHRSPGNLDTEDLLVIVLLLLMAGDCEEDRNTALLTLALYLFL